MPRRIEDPTLPHGWEALYDDDQQVTYYWDRSTGSTQYERPGGAPAAAPAPVANGNYFNGTHGETEQYSNGHAAVNAAPLAQAQASDGSVLYGDEYRRANEIQVQGNAVPDAMTTFAAAGFPQDIMNEIKRAGFAHPTPIQAQAWPVALQGRDLVAIAKTGSGKTCGFLLPGLMHIRNTSRDPRHGPTVLVLAPTRELAVQIKQEADKFGYSSHVRNTCVYGGAPKGPQLRDLRNGVQIVIATPGRLNDFTSTGDIRLHQVSYLVLDEADRMLDMGFEPQIQQIVRMIPPQRQTLFFSATWPREVRNIAAQFVANETVHIFIGPVSDKLVANKSITQNIELIEGYQKVNRLIQILSSKPRGSRFLVFTGTKRGADDLVRQIGREFSATAIHGDKRQQERDWALRSFKQGQCPVLVATDVAARGLDIPEIGVVVNFDFPSGVEDYVHRIGRTGRAGRSGEAFTFFTHQDGRYARELCQVLRDAEQPVPSDLENIAMRAPQGGGRNRWGGGGRGFGGHGRSYGSTPNFQGGGFQASLSRHTSYGSFSSTTPSSGLGGGRSSYGDRDRDRDRSDRGFGDRGYGGRGRSRSRSPHRRRSPSYGR